MLFMENNINMLIKKKRFVCGGKIMSKQMAPLYLRSVSGLPRRSFLHDLLGLMDVRNLSLFEKTQESLSVAMKNYITKRVYAMIQISLGSSIAQHVISLKCPFIHSTERVDGDDIDTLERIQIQQKKLNKIYIYISKLHEHTMAYTSYSLKLQYSLCILRSAG